MNLRETTIRLQVFLAHAGIASRRAAEEIISQGRVQVNGITITAQGFKINDGDTVLCDGKPVAAEKRMIYLALNKPSQYICASSDPQGRSLALDLLSSQYSERLYNVGRLDYLSCGLIFFTNDGEFAARLSHPSTGIEKEYLIEATGPIPEAVADAFNSGIAIEGVFYQAKSARKIGRKTMRIILVEGKNREIRRVFSYFHLHPVILRRERIGPVLLGNLQEAQNRPLTNEELEALRSYSW